MLSSGDVLYFSFVLFVCLFLCVQGKKPEPHSFSLTTATGFSDMDMSFLKTACLKINTLAHIVKVSS